MEFLTEEPDILDILFDQNDGLLKEELSNNTYTLDLSSLGLLSDDVFNSNLLNEPESFEQESKSKSNTIYSEHDYAIQQSPSHSDSGVSMESASNSPKYDQFQNSPSDSSLSEFPQNLDQFSPTLTDFSTEASPPSNQTEFSPLNFDDLDISDLNFVLKNFDEPSVPDVNSVCDVLEKPGNKDISIDFGFPTELLTVSMVSDSNSSSENIKIIHVSSSQMDTLPFSTKDVDPSLTAPSTGSELKLSEEELDLLSREGMVLPTNMALTKEEERCLKLVRRKIRNKVSAKESRKRKVDYVDGLEKRVKVCTVENQQLQKKMTVLEKQNVSLMSQLRKIQALVVGKTVKSANTTTCIMVLLLSFAFLVVPTLDPFGIRNHSSEIQSVPTPGKSRSLLNNADEFSNPNNDDPYGLTIRPGPPWESQPKTPFISVPPTAQVDIIGKNIPQESTGVEVSHVEYPGQDDTINSSHMEQNAKYHSTQSIDYEF